LMHAETFSYILHGVAYESKFGAPDPDIETAIPQPRMIEIPAGSARLGLNSEDGFGWDNEFRAHTVEEPAFSISRYKVTNRDYLDFVRAGASAPFFWTERGGRWFCRGMFHEVPLPLDCPVYVTREQAQQYAEWRRCKLPTEAQFQRAAEFGPPEASGNFDFRRWDPIPVNANDNGSARPSQLFGNGWEWTSTLFAPFPGFEPFPFYRNYSEPFFDGEHYVLKGASPRTAACMVRPSFRNWFRPSYPYVYATFRLVE
jgi:iron(II)-dependent oxidoreductase